MILVAFLRVMPGMTFLRITTTSGIECSQSLCKMTFQGRSGLALLPVWVPSALLICVAVISWEPFCHRLAYLAYLVHPILISLIFSSQHESRPPRTLTRRTSQNTPSTHLGEWRVTDRRRSSPIHRRVVHFK